MDLINRKAEKSDIFASFASTKGNENSSQHVIVDRSCQNITNEASTIQNKTTPIIMVAESDRIAPTLSTEEKTIEDLLLRYPIKRKRLYKNKDKNRRLKDNARNGKFNEDQNWKIENHCSCGKVHFGDWL